MLPTRVLDVGQKKDPLHLRLVEARGLYGQYVTLSHCWGPPSRLPLITTKYNLRDHLNEISFDQLSKTFQDAIVVTRELGIQYLWIDALCILQGDQEDWLQESTGMGLIYENARLTIAASGAGDGTRGCFLGRQAPTECVGLPQFDEVGDTGSVFLTIRDASKGKDGRYLDSIENPDLSPLSSRAWITQEWQLSRRLVHYRNGQMIWCCNSIAQGEDGREFGKLLHNKTSRTDALQKFSRGNYGTEEAFLNDRKFSRTQFWTTLVSNYRSRDLTFPSDTLVALQGVVAEVQRRWPDQRYSMGLWFENLHEQLLWMSPGRYATYLTRPESLHNLGMPTWSWASTLGAIRFQNFGRTKKDCSTMFVQNSKELVVSGRCKRTGHFQRPSFETSFQLRKLDNPSDQKVQQQSSSEEFAAASPGAVTGWNNEQPTEHMVFDTQDPPRPLGSACLDEGVVPEEPVSCVPLSSEIGSSLSNGTKHVWHNVLLLTKSNTAETANTYIRVGTGKVEHEKWFENVPEQTIRII